ncbi:uncharacterized protein LOC113558764 [Rhopalosiphum maidis]|uniref:uncharacterized protein LOC113558764 n=1 Tax=Rhopalosiphum maidis TaxID=43146 RepID=UPI000F001CDC|nr:uncharacterized protein LOC113558764 [Rhopalosiphum maidis]
MDESTNSLKKNFNLYKYIVNQNFSKLKSRLVKCESLVKENKKLKDKVLCLELKLFYAEQKLIEHDKLKNDMLSLESKLFETNHKLIDNDIVIDGIPNTDNENILEIVINLTIFLDVPLNESTINDCYRIKSIHDNNKTGKIVVKFIRKIDKIKILNAVKDRKMFFAKDIGFTENNVIYIQENISADLNVLFKKIRDFKKSYNFRYSWTSNGHVFLRQNSTSDVFRVSSESDLIKMEKEFNKLGP